MSAHGLIDAIATATPPALDFTVRPGTRPAAEVERAVDAWCSERGIAAERRPLLVALGLLYHDHEAEAHALCQAREGQPDADLIHAILHRREGDAGNARYWWRAVGAHPVFPALAEAARRHGLPVGAAFDPVAVVDAVVAGRHPDRLIAWQNDEFRVVAAHLAG